MSNPDQQIPLSDLRPFMEKDYLLRAVVTTSGRAHMTNTGQGRAAGDSEILITARGVQRLIDDGELTLRAEKAAEAAERFGLHPKK